jgi:hypothetical protein
MSECRFVVYLRSMTLKIASRWVEAVVGIVRRGCHIVATLLESVAMTADLYMKRPYMPDSCRVDDVKYSLIVKEVLGDPVWVVLGLR